MYAMQWWWWWCYRVPIYDDYDDDKSYLLSIVRSFVQVFEFIHGLSLLRLIIRSQTAQFMRLCEVEEDHEE